MAVFVVTLRDLRPLREPRRGAQSSGSSPADVVADASAPAGTDAVAPRDDSRRSEPVSAATAEAPDVDGLLPANWLTLPREQIEALLAQAGESGKKAVLALLYRLATLEGELAEIRRQVSGDRKPGTIGIGPAVLPGRPVTVPADKLDLLEQVFRKNLSLRKMG